MVLLGGEVLTESGLLDGDTLEKKPLIGSTFQRFEVLPVAGTCYFTIVNKVTLFCLEAAAGLGADVIQKACIPSHSQQWKLIPTF
jgi:hypothetical protein